MSDGNFIMINARHLLLKIDNYFFRVFICVCSVIYYSYILGGLSSMRKDGELARLKLGKILMLDYSY